VTLGPERPGVGQEPQAFPQDRERFTRRFTRFGRLATAAPAVFGRAVRRLLSVSRDVIYSLLASGALAKVVIPGRAGSNVRRTLIDRHDLDRLLEAWKVNGQ
jgi:hypothetical protein